MYIFISIAEGFNDMFKFDQNCFPPLHVCQVILFTKNALPI